VFISPYKPKTKGNYTYWGDIIEEENKLMIEVSKEGKYNVLIMADRKDPEAMRVRKKGIEIPPVEQKEE